MIATCIYCGHEVRYGPRRGVTRDQAHQALIEHDKVCPENPVVQELQAATDFAEDRARLLGLVREKLGVPSEPHQSIDERTFEAIDEIAARSAVEWSSIAVLKLLEEIEQQVGAAIPASILNDALAKVGLRERFGNEAIDRAKEAARSALAEKFASGEEV
ncbi:hypothetical protein [Halomonas getboli]|uniref:hypothetical protein n=1 Tax=Halomonas getboli TaxID=2935862 RepID=UPI001FFF1F1B|nr:hypothetical protein [Halomonas getboli]MCK2185716.1 hypothetical protein [Halomonas getboli]